MPTTLQVSRRVRIVSPACSTPCACGDKLLIIGHALRLQIRSAAVISYDRSGSPFSSGQYQRFDRRRKRRFEKCGLLRTRDAECRAAIRKI